MKITYQWLKEYIDWKASPSKLEEVLTDLGVEVEDCQNTLSNFQDVVVGQIRSCKAHPNAEKLKLCEVSIAAEQTLSIVCGATNVGVGLRVPVALPTAILPFGQLKPREIRGIFSEGMICSEEELGFTDQSEGIWILDESFEIGEDFRSYFEDDIKIELSITPNRPDWLGLRGILRELTVKTGIPHHLPVCELIEKPLQNFDIEIEDPEGCSRYVGALIKGVTIQPSPQWLKRRLEAIGQRSINNVVDLTNYLMILYGHPMHAFDADTIKGRKIVVRKAFPEEKLRTLDGEDRVFDSEDLLICDSENASAIAGIMGGANSEIETTTKNVFLEVACFDPVRIRKTSKKQKLHTEASHRFERGMDPEFPKDLAHLAIEHILKLAGGEYEGTLDIYPRPFISQPVQFPYELTTRILGIDFDPNWINKTLQNFGCCIEQIDSDNILVYPPSFRYDLERPIDIVEEIARIHGYNEIPFEAPRAALQLQKDKPLEIVINKTRNALLKEGLSECVSYSFAREKHSDSVELINPLAEDVAFLRTNITDKLLETVIYNFKQQNTRIGLFETGVVFSKDTNQQITEEFHAGIAISGMQLNDWKNKNCPTDFFDLKGVIERLFGELHQSFQWKDPKIVHHRLEQSLSQDIFFQGKVVGQAGMIQTKYLNKQKIYSPVAIAEINLKPIIEAKSKSVKYKTLPGIPSAEKQLALITPQEISAQEIVREIIRLKIKDLENYRIFDLYQGKGIPDNHKSLGISFLFRGKERSLSEEEMGQQLQKVLDALASKFGISLRP